MNNKIKTLVFFILKTESILATNNNNFNKEVNHSLQAHHLNKVVFKHTRGLTLLSSDSEGEQELKENYLKTTLGTFRQPIVHSAKKIINSKKLMTALKYGDLDKIETLTTRANIDLNYKNVYEESLLIVSIDKNHKKTTDFLIKNNANIEIKNIRDETPLIVAAKHNDVDVMESLISHSANLEAKNSFNETPLMVAIKHNSADATTTLVNYRANLEARNSFDETPLMVAMKKQHTELAVILIKNNANFGVKNMHGEAILDMAKLKKNTNVIIAVKQSIRNILSIHLLFPKGITSIILDYLISSQKTTMYHISPDWY